MRHKNGEKLIGFAFMNPLEDIKISRAFKSRILNRFTEGVLMVESRDVWV